MPTARWVQRTGGNGLTGRRSGGAGVRDQPCATLGAQCAPGIGTQFRALAAQGPAMVVGLVPQVAKIQFADGMAAGQLQAQLRIGVVEYQAVVAGSGPLP
ncbi:hypothetical protein G6F31_021675 [Rhizopus arrhizus]|nr:hypothetical protein G6F31_021675 [Rhizopus arrhizus]